MSESRQQRRALTKKKMQPKLHIEPTRQARIEAILNSCKPLKERIPENG